MGATVRTPNGLPQQLPATTNSPSGESGVLLDTPLSVNNMAFDTVSEAGSVATASVAAATFSNRDGDYRTTTTTSSGKKILCTTPAFDPCRSLFCSPDMKGKHTFMMSSSVEENLAHMKGTHTFMIPDQEYCVEPSSLLNYLYLKITEGHTCLYCDREFASE